MSQYQASVECVEEEDVQVCREPQGLENAQVCKAEEERALSSGSPLVPGTLLEAPVAETPNASEGLQDSCFSSSNPEQGASSQGNEQISHSPEAAAVPGDEPRSTLEDKVSDLVSFLLFKYQMKEPIRKAHMLAVIEEEDEALFRQMLLQASEIMELAFGLDVKEVDPVNHCYGVSITLGLTYDGLESNDDEDNFPKTAFLILVLGVIFLKGNRTTEEEFWEALNLTGVHPGKGVFLFGKSREVIMAEFVREKYVKYQPVANSDPVQYEFLWGPRAYAETSKLKVLKFVTKGMGLSPRDFPSRYKEALIEEIQETLLSIFVWATLPPRSTECSCMVCLSLSRR